MAIQPSAPGVLCNCMMACATWSGLDKSNTPLVRRVQRMPILMDFSPMMELSLHAYSYKVPRPFNDIVLLFMFLDRFVSTNGSSRTKATFPTMAGSGGIPALKGRSDASTPINSSAIGSGSNGCSAAGSTAGVGADGVPGVLVPNATRSARTNALKRDRQTGVCTLCSELNAQALHPTVGPYLMIRSRVMYSFLLWQYLFELHFSKGC